MPRIREYEERVASVGPQETRRVTGEDMGSGVGRSIAQLGGQVEGLGNVLYQRQEQQDLSDANVRLSQIHADYTNELNDQIKKGTVDSEKFLQKFDEKLGAMEGDYSTVGAQDFVRNNISKLRGNFAVSTVNAQSDLAGTKAAADYQTAHANWSSGLMGSPSDYQLVKSGNVEYLDKLVANGSLPAKAAEELKIKGQKDLAVSAVRGWMDLNPEDTKKQLKQGLWDNEIDGATKRQLEGEADGAIRAKRTDQMLMDAEAKKALEQSQKHTQNKFLEGMASGKLTAKDVLRSNLEPFGTGGKSTFLSMLEQDAKGGTAIKTDSGVFTDLFQRIHLPPGDPKAITNENDLNKYFGNGLTLDNIKSLRAEIQGKGTEAGSFESAMKKSVLDMAKQKLTKTNEMMGIKDPDGEQSLQMFMLQMNEDLAAGKKAGKTTRELFDPTSPSYVGKSVPSFMKSPAEIMKAQMSALKKQKEPNGITAPRAEGESAEAYLKRIKKEPGQ